MKKFFNLEHAANYLRHSIIRHSHRPISVLNIAGKNYTVEFRYLDTGRTNADLLYGGNFDLSPVPLGYINYGEYNQFHTATRASRNPLRQWKVGLCENTLTLKPNDPREVIPSPSEMILSKFLCRTIVGEYPSLKNCLDNVASNRRGFFTYAFSRRFALSSDGNVFNNHQNGPVGKWNKDNGVIDLKPEAKFLHEILAEDTKHGVV